MIKLFPFRRAWETTSDPADATVRVGPMFSLGSLADRLFIGYFHTSRGRSFSNDREPASLACEAGAPQQRGAPQFPFRRTWKTAIKRQPFPAPRSTKGVVPGRSCVDHL